MNTTQPKFRLALGASALAVATALAFGSAQAASTTSNLQGFAGTSAAGSVVTAVNEATGERAAGRVGPDGNYVILGLPPGRYHVQLGKVTKEAVLPVDETIYVDFNEAAGTSVSGVVVTAAARGA
ncbi:MAG TPA: carboxypeptidase-like regulatory domain-containing protein, partial [Caulobacteraceae bacterium]|nr:carboxypeptidase-like regulatory domain-containing protein [Caulobacteraceae bacterium]